MTATIPFVRPTKENGAGGTFGKSCPDLPVENLRLCLFAVSEAVQAEFGQQ